MVSKELGAWSVIEGDPNEGEDPSDLYLDPFESLRVAFSWFLSRFLKISQDFIGFYLIL